MVCVVVLCLCYVATGLASDAASPLANCPHKNAQITYGHPTTPVWVNYNYHEYIVYEIYMCFDCGTVFYTHKERLRLEEHWYVGDVRICMDCNGPV